MRSMSRLIPPKLTKQGRSTSVLHPPAKFPVFPLVRDLPEVPKEVKCETFLEIVPCGAATNHFDYFASFVICELKTGYVLWNGIELRLLLYDFRGTRVSEFSLWRGCCVTLLCLAKGGDYAANSVFGCAFGHCKAYRKFNKPALIVYAVHGLILATFSCIFAFEDCEPAVRSVSWNEFEIRLLLNDACKESAAGFRL